MEDVKFKTNGTGNGRFYVEENGKQLGEMIIHTGPAHLTVYHTEVVPEAEGMGLAKQLLEAMVAYARANALKVIPLCVYVLAQFKRHPENYADIWQKD